jgi:hypothetical protein
MDDLPGFLDGMQGVRAVLEDCIAIAGAASRDRADLVVRPWLQPGRVMVGSSASRRSTLRTMGPTSPARRARVVLALF